MTVNLVGSIAAGAVLVATGFATAADALVLSEVDTDDVMFSNLAFADFSTHSTVVLAYPSQGSWGASVNVTFVGTTNATVFSTGSVSLAPPPSNGNLSAYVGAASADGAPGTLDFGFDVAGPGAYLTPGVANGLHTLAYSGGVAVPGGTITSSTIDVLLPGDWSASGASTGDHTFSGVDPSFSVVDDFVYDSTTNTTEVEYLSTTYQGGFADLDFTLYGSSAVPEIPTWTMLILGVGGMGCVLRRRRVPLAV